MKKIIMFIFALPIGMISTLQAATTFQEGARDVVTIHPSCREENTGLTAMGVVLPNGPEINVTLANPGGEEKTITMTLPIPRELFSTSRSGEVFNANPIMDARPSFNLSAIFGMDIITASVPAFGSNDTTEDTKMVFWKLKGVNVYDVDSNTVMMLPYVPASELITVELGFSLPKFTADSCLATMNVRGTQIARCDQIDPETKTILTESEPDIRTKRMRLTVERDMENNPLPASCGEGLNVTIEPTDAEAEEIVAKVAAMKPNPQD